MLCAPYAQASELDDPDFLASVINGLDPSGDVDVAARVEKHAEEGGARIMHFLRACARAWGCGRARGFVLCTFCVRARARACVYCALSASGRRLYSLR